MRRAELRLAAAGSRLALSITVAAVIACLIGVPAWAQDTELSAEQLAEWCPKVDRLTADDLPEDVELAEVRDACARWTAESAEADEESSTGEHPQTVGPEHTPDPSATADSSATADPSPTPAPSPTPDPQLNETETDAAAGTARSSGGPPAERPQPAGPSAAAEPTTPRAEPTEPPSTDPMPPATLRAALPAPPPATTRAALPPPPLPPVSAAPDVGLLPPPVSAAPEFGLLPPVSAAPEFGLLGFEPNRRPTDLAAIGTATALPTETPTLPRPMVLATLLLAAVGTFAVRSGMSRERTHTLARDGVVRR
jgi:hypothetical protein